MSNDKAWFLGDTKYETHVKSDVKVSQQLEDSLKKFYELEKILKESKIVSTPQDVSQRLKELKDQKNLIEDQIQNLEQAEAFLDSLAFKEGDVAFHKEHGNVLVKGVVLDEVILENTHYMIVSTKTQVKVPYKELLPVNNTTKTLYGKT